MFPFPNFLILLSNAERGQGGAKMFLNKTKRCDTWINGVENRECKDRAGYHDRSYYKTKGKIARQFDINSNRIKKHHVLGQALLTHCDSGQL